MIDLRAIRHEIFDQRLIIVPTNVVGAGTHIFNNNKERRERKIDRQKQRKKVDRDGERERE